jgi:hypothetical protein
MTTTAIPVVTLSAVKYAEFNSEETNCFSANVLIDGVKVGAVSNEGHGGGDNFFPFALEQRLNEIAALMPPIDTKYNLSNTAELLIGDIFENWLVERDFKTAIKKRLMHTRADGKVYQTKALPAAELAGLVARGEDALKVRMPDAVEILNCLPYAEALALFKAGTSKL